MTSNQNSQCPDFSSHSQNALEAYCSREQLSEDELTADDHEAIDAAAEREYLACEGH